VNNQTIYYPYKYKQRIPTTPSEDYMLLRLGEQYLIRAEAAAELGNLTGALADVNIIRARAGLAGSTAVRKERRTELCFEGANRWFDLNRTVNDTKYPSNGQITAVLSGWQPYDALYPIPLAQRELNSHLIQNPGYH
jgi:hypothetical protein